MGRPFNEKKLIGQATYGKLRTLRCEFNHEGLFRAWVNLTNLVQFARNLHHLVVKRKLQYKSLTGKVAWERGGRFEESKVRNPFQRLDQVVDPISGKVVPGTVQLKRLRTLEVKNYFEESFLADLVAHNSQSLEVIKLKRDTIRG